MKGRGGFGWVCAAAVLIGEAGEGRSKRVTQDEILNDLKRTSLKLREDEAAVWDGNGFQTPRTRLEMSSSTQ